MFILPLILAACAPNDYAHPSFDTTEDRALGMKTFGEIVDGLENIPTEDSISNECGSSFVWSAVSPFTVSYSPNTFDLFSVDYRRAECIDSFEYADKMAFGFVHENQVCIAEAESDPDVDSYVHSYFQPECVSMNFDQVSENHLPQEILENAKDEAPQEIYKITADATYTLMLGLSLAVAE